MILIEAKSHTEKLDKHDSQLFRYFGTTNAKFAILTNGVVYKFYSDLDQPNIMDSQPFFICDMENLSEQNIQYLENFKKSNLDINSILNTASDLKYISLTKNAFRDLIESPNDEFIKIILNNGVYDGIKNQKIIDKFKPIVKRAINQFINEKMSTKFKETLNSTENDNEIIDTESQIEENKIVTTIDELNAFAIVKSILRTNIEPSRILYKDTESYFGILLDGNIRKWICRIILNSKNKHVFIPDENKKAIRYDIQTLDDIYKLENDLMTALDRYRT